MTTVNVQATVRDLSEVKLYPKNIFYKNQHRKFLKELKSIITEVLDDPFIKGISSQLKSTVASGKVVNKLLDEYIVVYSNGEYLTKDNSFYLSNMLCSCLYISDIDDIIATAGIGIFGVKNE